MRIKTCFRKIPVYSQWLLAFPVLISLKLSAQSIYIPTGSRFTGYGNISIAVDNGDILNNGISVLDSATIFFTGKNATSYIRGNVSVRAKKIVVYKSSGELALVQTVYVHRELEFKKGNLDLNGNNLMLGQDAYITNETTENRVVGPGGGEVQLSIPLNAGILINPGNLGVSLQPVYALGLTKISRGHKIQYSRTLGQSATRYFNITPQPGNVIRTSLRFQYLEAELNNLAENNLQLYSSADSGRTWTRRGFTTKNAGENFVELRNTAVLSHFTISTPEIFRREAIPEPTGEESVRIIPNPVQDIALLQLVPHAEGNATVSIYNSDGKLMLKKSVFCYEGKNQINFSTQNFASGTYHAVIIYSDGEVRNIAFIKN